MSWGMCLLYASEHKSLPDLVRLQHEYERYDASKITLRITTPNSYLCITDTPDKIAEVLRTYLTIWWRNNLKNS